MRFLSAYETYPQIMKSISAVTRKLFKFSSFCPQNLVFKWKLEQGPKWYCLNCKSSCTRYVLSWGRYLLTEIFDIQQKPIYKNQNFKNYQAEISELILSKTFY